MHAPRLILIAAASRNGVLSCGGRIPWHLPRDVAHFRAQVQGKWLLLGRTTYQEMRGWFRPGHVPVVLSRQAEFGVPGGWVVASVSEALALAEREGAPELWCCGGGQVYAVAIPEADEILLTTVDLEVPGDTFFPALSAQEWRKREEASFPPDLENSAGMTIARYVRSKE
jgi:dihydrofolate reductase